MCTGLGWFQFCFCNAVDDMNQHSSSPWSFNQKAFDDNQVFEMTMTIMDSNVYLCIWYWECILVDLNWECILEIENVYLCTWNWKCILCTWYWEYILAYLKLRMLACTVRWHYKPTWPEHPPLDPRIMRQ